MRCPVRRGRHGDAVTRVVVTGTAQRPASNGSLGATGALIAAWNVRAPGRAVIMSPTNTPSTRAERIVVTGAAGNLGSSIVPALLASGREVVSITRHLPTTSPWSELDGVRWQTADIGVVAAEPGWVRLAARAPLVDTGRARTELDWTPRRSAQAVLADFAAGGYASRNVCTVDRRRRSRARSQSAVGEGGSASANQRLTCVTRAGRAGGSRRRRATRVAGTAGSYAYGATRRHELLGPPGARSSGGTRSRCCAAVRPSP